MPSPEDDIPDEPAQTQETHLLSDLVSPFQDRMLNASLELFRVKFERETGREVDLGKGYTSTLSRERQMWLLKHFPKRYFAGLPEFVSAFLDSQFESIQAKGALDDVADELLTFYNAKRRSQSYGRAA